MSEKPDNLSTPAKPTRRLRAAALALTIVAACFSAVVAGRLMVQAVPSLAGGSAAAGPYSETSELTELKSRLVRAVADGDRLLVEKITGEVRQADVQLRETFFLRRAVTDSGRWLLAVGLVVALLAAHWYVSIGRRPPLPPLDAGSGEPDWPAAARRNAAGVGVAAASACLAFLATIAIGSPDLSAPEPPAVHLEGRWPAFRGPQMTGHVPAGDWPEAWSATTGESILWKCPIPGEGNSSPVVWGDRVYLTTGTARECWVHCIDAVRGRIAWSARVARPADAPEPDPVEPGDLTGYAAPTPVTDGEHVWATFRNADVACFDADGRQRWAVNLGKPVSQYGLAASLVLFDNLVILQHDQGHEADEGLSWMIAFDKLTGAIAWRTARDVRNSWSTPIVIGPADGLDHWELVACGDPYVAGYDPAKGGELWRARGLAGDIAAMPVFVAGLVIATNEGTSGRPGRTMAIRPGGSGDVTDSRVVWTAEESLPDLVSPLADDERFLTVTSNGTVTCSRASDGTPLWQHEFHTLFKASPSLVGRRVYMIDARGKAYLFDFADTFSLARTCDLGEPVAASPAFADGRIYIRTERNLYCIGRQPGPAEEERASSPGGTAGLPAVVERTSTLATAGQARRATRLAGER